MKWIVVLGVALYALSRGVTMALAVKPGVQLSTTWQVNMMRDAVRRSWEQYGLNATITSSMDGQHMVNSLHGVGLAEDYRTKDLPDHLKYGIFEEVRNILGIDFQVLFEYEGLANEHLHIEYDPR